MADGLSELSLKKEALVDLEAVLYSFSNGSLNTLALILWEIVLRWQRDSTALEDPEHQALVQYLESISAAEDQKAGFVRQVSDGHLMLLVGTVLKQVSRTSNFN